MYNLFTLWRRKRFIRSWWLKRLRLKMGHSHVPQVANLLGGSYPLVICHIAIEHGHWNSEFSHEQL